MLLQLVEALLMILGYRFYKYMKNRNRTMEDDDDSIEKKDSELKLSGTW